MSVRSRSSASRDDSVHHSTIISANVWEVYSPPPINSLKGALIPRALTNTQRRKISLEVHKIRIGGDDTNTYEECIVRVLEPSTRAQRRAARKRAREERKNKASPRSVGGSVSGQSLRSSTVLNSDLRNLQRMDHQYGDSTRGEIDLDFDDDEDDASAGDNSTAFQLLNLDNAHNQYAMPPQLRDLEQWNIKYRFPISNFSIKGGINKKAGVFIHIHVANIQQTRQLIFDSLEEAEDFVSVATRQLNLVEQRQRSKLKAAFHGQEPDEAVKEEITFLIEVVSACDLPIGDTFSSDPYVVCSFHGKDLHRTKYIPRTLDPIWTIETDSLFLATIDPKELFLSEGLLFTVYDYDAFGKNERLGSFYVPARDVYDGVGERQEYKLLPPPGSGLREVTGYLALRFRRASEHDINFMREHKFGVKHLDLKQKYEEANRVAGGVGTLTSYFRSQQRFIKDEEGREIKQYRIRPGSDPKRPGETTWMSNEKLQAECLRESEHWLDIGSGRLGRMYVEILGCDGLPNLDTGGRNKSDPFVSIVYEDAVTKTDIIDDCLDPRWMPWTKRAFVLHIRHMSSQLFLGVFDYDGGPDDHDLIGRVSVDLSNLRPHTLYILKYGIYPTARLAERDVQGTITLRMRIEIEDERAALLSSLEPPPEFYVNVKKRKDFRVVRFTCLGKYDMSRYDLKYLNAYIEELLAAQHISYLVGDAAMVLFLWRGTFRIDLLGTTFYLPIHSFMAFVVAVTLIEHPGYFPSALFGSIGWLMIATMDFRRNLPDPWTNNNKTFREFLTTLATGSSNRPSDSIQAFQNHEEARAMMDNWTKRVSEAEEAAERANTAILKAQEEYEKEMEDIGEVDGDLSTKVGEGISIDPFKSVLFPIQQNLAMVTRYLRHTNYILTWQECYISFWVTATCFVLSFVCFFVPWVFMVRWISRILVWTLFGPWMKLVDIYYFSKIKPLTEEERQLQFAQEEEKRRQEASEALAEARIKKEKTVKLTAMKKTMFGKFITRVPVLKEDRYTDTPLPDSVAIPYFPDPVPLSELAMEEAGYNRTRVPGQHLVGDMVPSIETIGFTEAPVGQATARPELVDRNSPAGQIIGGPPSTIQAYVRIGSLVTMASVISWVAVPFFAGVMDYLMTKVV